MIQKRRKWISTKTERELWKEWGQERIRESNGFAVCLWAVPWLHLCNRAWWYRLLDTFRRASYTRSVRMYWWTGKRSGLRERPRRDTFRCLRKKKSPLEWFLSPLESHRKAYVRMKRKEVYLWMCEVELEVWWFEPRAVIKWRFFPPSFPPLRRVRLKEGESRTTGQNVGKGQSTSSRDCRTVHWSLLSGLSGPLWVFK